MSTVETDCADNLENLKVLSEAQSALSLNVTEKQYEVLGDLTSCKESLNKLLEKVNLSHSQGSRVSVAVDRQEDRLNIIQSEIGLVKEKIAAGDTHARPTTLIHTCFLSVLTITSNLVALIL